jgi:PhzF family phenazine biosynthesis protein
MKLKLFQIDAFAERPFEGNPAAVVPLENWVADDLMQKIAAENNLAETAFFVKTAQGRYALRWFTPHKEVPLCGHATLASAFVIFTALDPSLDVARFDTQSGELTVQRGTERLALALPASGAEPFTAPEGFASAPAAAAGGAKPVELYFCAKGGGGAPALLAVWPSPADIVALNPNGTLEDILSRAGTGSLLATAQGDGKPYHFVSRFFSPYWGVPEDPVTGSAHGVLVPFWTKRLGKKMLYARQVSPRGGNLVCTDEGARVRLEGRCALYLTGEIEV